MENIPVEMIRPHLRDLPQAAFPEGFAVRPMRYPDDIQLWTEVQRSAETHFPIQDNLFVNQFGDDANEVSNRCYLVIQPSSGEAVGTISAWFGGKAGPGGEDWGRIHWVAVRPEYQGRGLGRAALAYALHRLVYLGHDRAWLATSTARLAALKLYLDFGFMPDLSLPDAPEAWDMVRSHLAHPGL